MTTRDANGRFAKKAPAPAPLDTIHPKVAAATAAGAGVTALEWIATSLGFDLPFPVAGALVTIGAFLAGYLKRGLA